MKLAAIDIGSNSVHMVIVEVGGSGAFRVLDREKDMVRLGSVTLSRRHLSAAAMSRGLETLRKYKRLARNHGVDKIVAVATSAIREAGNGEEFLDRIGREVGVWPKAVSGGDEAGLIYLSALHSVHLDGSRALVIDIGGGSVELALGAGPRVELAVSEKLGVLRMTERFVRSDPLSGKDEARLVEHVERVAGPHLAAIREAGFDVAVGTSGTILALGALARRLGTAELPESLHHVTVGAEAVHAVRRRLADSDVRLRLKMPGLDERRADIIVAGAVVLDTLLAGLGVRELVLSEWALREGILLKYIHAHPRTLARAEAYPDVRRRSVIELAERCVYDEAHSRHVAALATALFDGTRARHGLGDRERQLLEYAALLHDIGHHISHPGHHKHTYYLIKNGDLRGFPPEEIEILANLGRYHRRGRPRKKHPGFAALPGGSRRIVCLLAGLLRVADALDRSHRQVVGGLSISERSGALRVRAEARGDCELEAWGVASRTDLLQEALGIPVRVGLSASDEKRPRLRSGKG
jgi:exopolyphosphatase / guanosine-5'-triphosphate,3'-diphosphate pyrophosphatase